MIESARNELARRFSSSQEVTRLIQKAVHAAILDHKNAGNPIAVWENGQVVIVPPEEIELPALVDDDESLLDLLPAAAGEDDLLREIGFGFPAEFWSRYLPLVARRQAETLTPDEQAELISLSDQVEERTLRRTQALVELATQRNMSLDTLIQQMGIHPLPIIQ